MKKLLSILLAFAMVFSLASVSVFAEGTTPTGTITVNNYHEDVTISVYKLLDLGADYDAAAGRYPYKMVTAWEGFFTDPATGGKYIAIDASSKAITWIGGDSEDNKAQFAKDALAYAVANNIAPVKVSTDVPASDISGSTIVFKGLDLGYYLVDSTMGALCGLTTTNPNGIVNAKNGMPVMNKQVQEDLTSQWGKTNTADIGQQVEFRVTIDVHAGAQNYVIHDSMTNDDKLQFNFGDVTRVEHIKSATETVVYVAEPEGKQEDLDTILTVDRAPSHTHEGKVCNFEVKFTSDFCNSLKANNTVVVYYNGVLNEKAYIGNTNGNINTAWLSFGDGHETEVSTTTTYTYSFEIAKTDAEDRLIDGAEFKIYTNASKTDGETPIQLVKVKAENNVEYYRRATAEEINAVPSAVVTDVVVTKGLAVVEGFDNGTYYLEETVAPAGYNMLAARKEFTIADNNLDAIVNDSGVVSTGSGVHVVNRTGSKLPETGGMGTVMFVTFGTIVVIAAGVLLVTKKRMSMIDD